MPHALIVAHGSPADPAPQEARLAALAASVAALLPDWVVRGATLAAPGALEAALDGLETPRIYPFFMAEGWFTRTALPRRLVATRARDTAQLAPLGVDPGLPALMAQAALEGCPGAARDRSLLIAAHGSQVSDTSADSTHAAVARLAAITPFRSVRAGFVEQAPFLAEAARGLGPAICLPFFALRAGHVEDDVPQILAEAGFDGPLLPPIGEHPGIPGLIAAALRR
ncbi:MAG: sirohydrochlorin chelatase [Gemmobacter sp.]